MLLNVLFLRAPFCGYHDLCLVRNTVVKIGLELISMCQKESTTPDIEHKITEAVRTKYSEVGSIKPCSK